MTPLKLNAILLIAAIFGGFFVPQLAPYLPKLVLPMLAILVFLSARKINISTPTKHELAITFELFGVSYLILSSIYILLGFAITEPGVQIGIWLLALMPPAINVIPLSELLKGNVKESMLATILSIFFAIFIIPIGTHFFFETDISIVSLIKVLMLGIIIPSIFGIICKKYTILDKPTDYIIPVANSLIFYILIGLNSALLIENVNNSYFWVIVGVLILAKCGFVSWINMKFKEFQSKDERIDVVLFASFKNIALAATIAISAFAQFIPGILIPIAIESVLFACQLLFIEYLLTDIVKHHIKKPLRKVK